jgi:diadenosine tetraphosphatase ApaH/serine/threonine PP2A family protein phosphatase
VIALLSDVHGNLPALRACLEELRRHRPDAWVFLGDAVGYGAHPSEVCLLLQALEPLGVAGNHDLAVLGRIDARLFNPEAEEAVLWTREALTDSARAFLESLPLEAELAGPLPFHLVHGSPVDPPMRYILEKREAREALRAARHPRVLVGHTHVAGAFRFGPGSSGDYLPLRPGKVLDLEPGWSYVVNPGSVGQPRDGDPRAAAALLDVEKVRVIPIRVEYPVEEAARSILAAGLPSFLAYRLRLGV